MNIKMEYNINKNHKLLKDIKKILKEDILKKSSYNIEDIKIMIIKEILKEEINNKEKLLKFIDFTKCFITLNLK